MLQFFNTYIQKSIKNPLLVGSFLILVGSTAGNFFQFLFNLVMSRNLSVVDYGVLASLISLISLPTVLSSALLPTIVSFAATFYAKNELSLVRRLFLMLGKLSFILGTTTFIVFLVFAEQIGDFFQIERIRLIQIAGVNVFFGFVIVVNLALIKAKLAFRFLSFMNFLPAFLKFAFGVGLVYLGYGVYGAMIGMLTAAIVGYLFSFIPLRSIFSTPTGNTSLKTIDIIKFGGPAALIFFSLTSFITIDIVLVKHFFDPQDAGLYAGLSLIGRVIFFLSFPINMVILPLFTQKHTKKELSGKYVALSLGLILLPSLFLTLFYTLFPTFVIQFFLKNSEYLQVSSYLTIFAIYITCYSLVYVLSNIFLSKKRTEISIPLSIGALLQIILIWFFHSSFAAVITISITIMAILLLFLLIYYWHTAQKQQPSIHEST